MTTLDLVLLKAAEMTNKSISYCLKPSLHYEPR
jgi:hypothetical protein